MSRARRLRPTILVLLLSLVVSLASLTLVSSRGAFSDSTDNPGSSFASLSCFKPAQPGSVQSGTATSSANGTISVSITPVDAAMSFLVFETYDVPHDSSFDVCSISCLVDPLGRKRARKASGLSSLAITTVKIPLAKPGVSHGYARLEPLGRADGRHAPR